MSIKSFNKKPYYDDYDYRGHYKKVLFRPGTPVQTRELNELQSSIKKQLKNFSDHIFKNGSRVHGAAAHLIKTKWVQLLPTTFIGGSNVDFDSLGKLSGLSLLGKTSGMEASLVGAVNAENGDPPFLFVTYTNTGYSGEELAFMPGEKIELYRDGTLIYSVTSATSVTTEDIHDSLLYYINEGVFYFEGMFIENREQFLVVSKYGEPLNCKIGFDFIQEVVTAEDDPSLLDNDLTSTNAREEGADRYKAYPVLVKRQFDSKDGNDFILLGTVEDGKLRSRVSDTSYSDIMDMIAKRTYETYGNYTVNPFRVLFEDVDSNYLNAVISPGVAYVKGYRVENTLDKRVPIRKPLDEGIISGKTKVLDERTYIRLIPYISTGFSAYPNDPAAELVDGSIVKMYSDVDCTVLCGSFKVYDCRIDEEPANGDPIFRYYIYDISLEENKSFAECLFYKSDVAAINFKAQKADDDPTIYNANNQALLWNLGENIRYLRGDDEDEGLLEVEFKRKFNTALTTSGSNSTFSETLTEPDEVFGELGDNTYALINIGGAWRFVDLRGIGEFSFTNNNKTITFSCLSPIVTSAGSISSTAEENFCFFHTIKKSGMKEDVKTLTDVTISNISPAAGLIELANSEDLYSILSIKEYNSTSAAVPEEDVTERFTITFDRKDVFAGKCTIEANYTPPLAPIKWRVYAKKFVRGTETYGLYTRNSFNSVAWDSLGQPSAPHYTSRNGSDYNLLDCIDFRKTGTTSNVVPVIGSTVTYTYKKFVDRVDALCLDIAGNFSIKEGIPASNPIAPRVSDDCIKLYEINLKASLDVLKNVTTKFIENKRYTMRDIGKIETRIYQSEQAALLNLLEKKSKDMKIKGEDGYDRFKNGFIADNFQDFQAADVTSSDFRAAIDKGNRELRPSFTTRSKMLKADKEGSNCKFIGEVALIDFDSVVIDRQPFATKHLSINPAFVFNRKGVLSLTPAHDFFVDTTIAPGMTINVDTGVEKFKALADRAGFTGNEWGNWATTNSTLLSSESSGVSLKNAGKVIFEEGKMEIYRTHSRSEFTVGKAAYVVSVTETKKEEYLIDQARSGVNTSIESRTASYNLGDKLTDVSLSYFIAPRTIYFSATKMKKNTKVWAFFDKQNVSAYCAPMSKPIGAQLVTDSKGALNGYFQLPAGTFKTGDRTFLLTTDKTLSGDEDQIFTEAYCVYHGAGLDVDKQNVSMNVTTPIVIKSPLSEQKQFTVKNEVTTTSFQWDPIAQSFKYPQDYFLTGIDIFFYQKDLEDTYVWVEVRPMENGFPHSSIVLTHKILNSLDLLTSDDASIPHHIEFDFPVFVKANTDYCFIVGGYSMDTRMWMAKIGQPLIDNPSKILETQAAIGSSFRSQNSTTWNAEQTEDVKYTLYAAKFKTRDMTVKMNHVPEGKIRLSKNPFEGEIGKNRIRVYLPDHGLNAGDKTTISVYADTWIKVGINSGDIFVGATINSVRKDSYDKPVFTATISAYKQEDGYDYIQMKNFTGDFNTTDSFEYPEQSLYVGIDASSDNVDVNGYVIFPITNVDFLTTYPTPLNGFPTVGFNKKFTITEVDSMDSFIITHEGGAAQLSGRFGGDECFVSFNEKYDLFNVSGSYLPYGATEEWSLKGINHNPRNGAFTSSDYAPAEKKVFIPSQDTYLGQPNKLVSIDNISGNKRNTQVSAVFVAPDEWHSPILNTETFSLLTVSNRIEWVEEDQFDVEPNASGRYLPESDPMNGSENFKYVTDTITLQNPAFGLIISFDCYKDKDADFDVWFKYTTPYEPNVDIDSKYWNRIIGYTKVDSDSLLDRVEYELNLSNVDLQVELYTSNNVPPTIDNWDDVNDDGFASFKIKIVGKSKNSCKPPLFQSFRAIAVV